MPERAKDKPFLMPIEDVFSIQGRGTVVTGPYRARHRLQGRRGNRDRRLPRHEEDGRHRRRNVQEAARQGEAGDNVGLLLRGIEKKASSAAR
jgi:elongation factor Tu